jgi:hypothetical protein
MEFCIALHAHHEADLPVEFLTESYESRLNTIRTVKRQCESPARIALRERLFVEIKPDDMPPWMAKLGEELAKLRAEWDRLREGWDRLGEERGRLGEERATDLIAYHDAHCSCGWTRERRNIFTLAGI